MAQSSGVPLQKTLKGQRVLQALVLGFFPILTNVQAQPTLDSSNYGPVPGISYMAHYGGQQMVPAMGYDLIWDYTGATFAQEGTPMTYGPPGANAPFSSTVAEMNDSALYYAYYYSLRDTGVYCTGWWYDAMADGNCHGPNMQIPFPCTMGTSTTMPFFCQGAEVGLPFHEDGLVQCDGVGFGTLLLPHASIDNVLLVHRMEYLDHGTTDPHSPIQFDYWSFVDQYFFATPGTRVPLLNIEVRYNGMDTVYSSFFTDQYTVGQSGTGVSANRIVITPNPTTGRVTMTFPGPLTVGSFYSVYDAVGKLLFQRPLAQGQQSEEIDLARFGKGTYLLRISDQEDVCHEKVVVQ